MFELIDQNMYLVAATFVSEETEYLPGYYFSDETGELHGPFGLLAEARDADAAYAKWAL